MLDTARTYATPHAHTLELALDPCGRAADQPAALRYLGLRHLVSSPVALSPKHAPGPNLSSDSHVRAPHARRGTQQVPLRPLQGHDGQSLQVLRRHDGRRRPRRPEPQLLRRRRRVVLVGPRRSDDGAPPAAAAAAVAAAVAAATGDARRRPAVAAVDSLGRGRRRGFRLGRRCGELQRQLRQRRRRRLLVRADRVRGAGAVRLARLHLERRRQHRVRRGVGDALLGALPLRVVLPGARNLVRPLLPPRRTQHDPPPIPRPRRVPIPHRCIP